MAKPRLAYQDRWVVDTTLFEYVNQGSCSCCGVSHAVMDAARFFELCSDMETDDQRRERVSPWPPFMRDELWRDMVKIRAKLKATLPTYQEFVAKELDRFAVWWEELPIPDRRRVFQMPIEEVKVTYGVNFDVNKAYSVLSCGLLEQVKRFRETGIPPDGRTEWEIDFEDVLEVERGAFVVHDVYVESEEGVRSFLGMMAQVGGPKLLPRKEKSSSSRTAAKVREVHDDDGEGRAVVSGPADSHAPGCGRCRNQNKEEDADGSDDDEEEEEDKEPDVVEEPLPDAPSFRSDRRIMRLVIFRYFADRAIRRFRQQGCQPPLPPPPPPLTSAARTRTVDDEGSTVCLPEEPSLARTTTTTRIAATPATAAAAVTTRDTVVECATTDSDAVGQGVMLAAAEEKH